MRRAPSVARGSMAGSPLAGAGTNVCYHSRFHANRWAGCPCGSGKGRAVLRHLVVCWSQPSRADWPAGSGVPVCSSCMQLLYAALVCSSCNSTRWRRNSISRLRLLARRSTRCDGPQPIINGGPPALGNGACSRGERAFMHVRVASVRAGRGRCHRARPLRPGQTAAPRSARAAPGWYRFLGLPQRCEGAGGRVVQGRQQVEGKTQKSELPGLAHSDRRARQQFCVLEQHAPSPARRQCHHPFS
jgi:hypothetical protein